ncbi:unnamed protein product [Prunus brigantina]
MDVQRLGEMLKISEENLKTSCYLSLEAQKFPGEQFLVEKSPASSHAFFSFPGSWSLDGWYSGDKAFGEKKINLELFPSMKSISNYDEADKPEDQEFATGFVNQAFLHRFEHVLKTSQLVNQVEAALNEQKSIIFTGHSTGGAIAALATIWFLQKYPNNGAFFCVTFGSPLVGNHIISHALRREKWSQCFIHFVMRYDIVPRILLAPLTFIQEQFEKVLPFFNPASPKFKSEVLGASPEALHFYENVIRKASSLTSHVASQLMGNANQLLDTVKHFTKISPYKPFGTYVFCTGNGKLVVLKNPEAVLQTLSYSCLLSSETEHAAAIAHKCLNEHFGYEKEFLGDESSLDMQNVVDFDKLELRLGSDGYLDDLGLGVRARLSLCAARKFEEKKQENEKSVASKVEAHKEEMKKLEDYREFYKERDGGYYQAFKIQGEKKDFDANVSRLVLAGIWDEIIEMLKKYELPDEFECTDKWIDLGTKFRDLVEPLDIANYYRHAKGRRYMDKGGRPRRYKYAQRWLEHHEKKQPGACGNSSCHWADKEELLKR